MKYKLIVFDLDGTIAAHGKPVETEVAARLKKLEDFGLKLAIASGKNAQYLSGFARGMGLKHPVVIGENGCIIFDPVFLKEERLATRPDFIDEAEKLIAMKYGDSVLIQNNQVQLTIFPKTNCQIESLIIYVKQVIEPHQNEIVVLEHQDAVDILPRGIDKGKAVAALRKILKLSKKEIIAVGDWVNDLPMFSESGLSIVVGDKIKSGSNYYYFSTITESLNFIEEKLADEN